MKIVGGVELCWQIILWSIYKCGYDWKKQKYYNF